MVKHVESGRNFGSSFIHTCNNFRGDTQEIEGINSMIKMIGDRCPRIDILHLSSRIALKKSLGIGGSTAVKRWSKIQAVASPLLDEMVSSHGRTGRYKQVLDDSSRFATPLPVEMKNLGFALVNVDIARALPTVSVVKSVPWKWAAIQAGKLKRLVDQQKNGLVDSPRDLVFNTALLQGLAIENKNGQSAFFVIGTSTRSLLHLMEVNLEPNSRKLVVAKEVGPFTFQTSVQVFVQHFETCTSRGIRLPVHLLQLAPYCGNGVVGWTIVDPSKLSIAAASLEGAKLLEIDEQQEAISAQKLQNLLDSVDLSLDASSERELETKCFSFKPLFELAKIKFHQKKKAKAKAVPGDAENAADAEMDVEEHVDAIPEAEEDELALQSVLQDVELLEIGEGSAKDEEASERERDLLVDELDEDATAMRRAARIKQGVVEEASSSSSGKPANPTNAGSATDKYKPTLDALQQAMSYIQETHTGVEAALTSSELEEEALLLLIRNFERKDDNPHDAEVQKIIRSSEKTQRQRYILDLQPDFQAVNESDSDTSDTNSDTSVVDVVEPENDKDKSAGNVCSGMEDVNDANGGSGSAAQLPVPHPRKMTKAEEKALARLKNIVESWEGKVVSLLECVGDWHNRAQKPLDPEQHEGSELSFLHRKVTVTGGGGGDGDGNADAQPEPEQIEQGSQSEHEIFAVVWTDVVKRLGRTVRIDEKDRVVYSPVVMFGVKAASEDFSKCDILVNHAGACNKRYAGALRDQLPDYVSVFLRFCKLCVLHLNKDRKSCVFGLGFGLWDFDCQVGLG